MEPAVRAILFQLNVLGYAVRYEGDGREVSFVATHRLGGQFFAYTVQPENVYDGVCMLAEMCGVEQLEGDGH